jgi:hypothetical protein
VAAAIYYHYIAHIATAPLSVCIGPRHSSLLLLQVSYGLGFSLFGVSRSTFFLTRPAVHAIDNCQCVCVCVSSHAHNLRLHVKFVIGKEKAAAAPHIV